MAKKQIKKSENSVAKLRDEVSLNKKNRPEITASDSQDEIIATPEQMKKIKISLFSAAVFATVRLTLPVMILFAFGLFVDKALNQAAIFAILGAIVGFFVGGFLVYLQIKKINSSENFSEKTGGKSEKNARKNGGEK